MNKLFKKYIFWLALILISSLIVVFTLFYTKNIGFHSTKWTTGAYQGQWDPNNPGKTLTSTIGPGTLQTRTMQIMISFFGGGALGIAGALLQKVTKNRLAEVSILGIGSLNIFFVYTYAVILKDKAFGSGPFAILMPLFLIMVSVIGTIIVWAISRSRKSNKNTFVIVGIALQLLVEALSVIVVNPSKLIKSGKNSDGKKVWDTIKGYTLGKVRSGVSVSNQEANPVPWWLLWVGVTIIIIVIIIVIFLRKKIDTFETSEELANTTGIKAKRLKLVIFLLVALLAGATSAILGTVALLGIIAPSLARMMFKNKMLPILIGSFVIGGIMVSGAAFLSMQLGWRVSVGILSTAIVIPYFLFLMIRGT